MTKPKLTTRKRPAPRGSPTKGKKAIVITDGTLTVLAGTRGPNARKLLFLGSSTEATPLSNDDNDASLRSDVFGEETASSIIQQGDSSAELTLVSHPLARRSTRGKLVNPSNLVVRKSNPVSLARSTVKQVDEDEENLSDAEGEEEEEELGIDPVSEEEDEDSEEVDAAVEEDEDDLSSDIAPVAKAKKSALGKRKAKKVGKKLPKRNVTPEVDEESGSESEEDNTNAVKFEVPIKDGQSTRDLKLDPDSTTWLQFSVTIAALIGCPLSSLSLGYLLNTEVKTGKKSHILESQGELTSAFKNAKKAKKAEASKGKKGKVVVVMLVDTRSAKEKKATAAASQKAITAAATDAAALKAGEDHWKWIPKLKTRHSCAEHSGKTCFVMGSGHHYHFTVSDISYWANSIKDGNATLDTPPKQLKMTDAPVRARPQTTQHPANILQSNSNPQLYSNASHNTYPSYDSNFSTPHYNTSPQYPTPLRQNPTAIVMSSDGADPDDSVTFEKMDAWLRTIDDGPRGVDGQNFMQYAAALEGKGFRRVNHLDNEAITAEKLEAWFMMPPGDAMLIKKWARTDSAQARKLARRSG